MGWNNKKEQQRKDALPGQAANALLQQRKPLELDAYWFSPKQGTH
jgi:hypothetical protein